MYESSRLTLQEKKILMALSSGGLDKQIAIDCGISTNTLRNHLKNIYRKLEVSKRDDAILIFHDAVNKVTQESFIAIA